MYRLADPRVLRMAEVIERNHGTGLENGPPCLNLADCLLASVGAVDVEQIDSPSRSGAVSTRGVHQREPVDHALVDQLEVQVALRSLDRVVADYDPLKVR